MGMLNPNHIFSFSQLQSFSECPYAFYLQKIERNSDMVNNAFASQGTLIHDLLDLWAKGELTAEQLPAEYERRYPLEVVESWPRMLAAKGYAEKAFQIGLDYFNTFDQFKGYKIIATEERFKIDVEGRTFVGIMDMLVEEEETGKLIVVDHKSKSLAAFKKAEDEMYRQQYLYSKHVMEKYGKYPDKLMFNLFKENGLKMERDFSEQDYLSTLVWAGEQMTKMEEYDFVDWLVTKEVQEGKPDFFCTELCSCRKVCPNGQMKYTPKRK
jgi:RecB family exonuclease